MKTIKSYQKLLIGIIISAIPFALSANVSTNTLTQTNQVLSPLEEYIKTSFILRLDPSNPNATGILSLIAMNKTEEAVEMGQSSFTPEFKQELAQVIDFDGEVVEIFGALDMIQIKTSTEEAERLKSDIRILSVEQNRILTTASDVYIPKTSETGLTEKTPFFDGERLNIPIVNTSTNLIGYKDVEFKRTEQGLWELLEYKENVALGALPLQNVELIATDTFPIQVYLKISGEFGSGCGSVGHVTHSIIDNAYNVSIYSSYLGEFKFDGEGRIIEEEPLGCTQALVPFEKTIPLSVYSLPAGEYTYNVNDRFTGTFNLEQDNVLQSSQ